MREQSRIKKLVIFWRCTYFYDDGKSLGKFTNKMGRRIETVTRIWRTIRTLEIRSNFFGVRVGSKQKITTKVLMVTVFLRQNAKHFRISFWKPLELPWNSKIIKQQTFHINMRVQISSEGRLQIQFTLSTNHFIIVFIV